MKGNLLKAHLALLAANLIYGINYIVAKGVMPNKIGPSAFILVRLLGATLLFWIVKSFVKEQVKKTDLPRLILCGLLGAAVRIAVISSNHEGSTHFFHGLNLTSPIDASIIITSVPVLVLILSAFVLKESITTNKVLGILVGGIGAILLIWYGKKAGGNSSVLGNFFIFLNTSCYATYLVIVKPLMKKYSAITVISWVFLFGLIFAIPIGIQDLRATDFSAFDFNTYASVGYVVLFTTFFAYLFNIYALNYVSPSVNGSYIYLQPVVSFIVVSFYAYVLMHTEYANDIDAIKIVSCVLVVIGVYLISKTPKKVISQ